MAKILMHARLCSHNMTCAVSLQLKVPVEFSSTVSKLSRLFFRSIPIVINHLEPEMKRNMLNNTHLEKQ